MPNLIAFSKSRICSYCTVSEQWVLSLLELRGERHQKPLEVNHLGENIVYPVISLIYSSTFHQEHALQRVSSYLLSPCLPQRKSWLAAQTLSFCTLAILGPVGFKKQKPWVIIYLLQRQTVQNKWNQVMSFLFAFICFAMFYSAFYCFHNTRFLKMILP